MKKVIWICLVLGIVILGVYIYKKAQTAFRIVPGIESFKLNISGKGLEAVANAFMQIVSGGISATANIKLTSYGTSTISVNQIYAEIYNKNGSLLATQNKPLDKVYSISPGVNILPLPVDIARSGVIQLANAIKNTNNGSDSVLREILLNYVTTGLLGTSVTIKGYIVAEGITVNLNETVNI